jgi:hypothetical protein
MSPAIKQGMLWKLLLMLLPRRVKLLRPMTSADATLRKVAER